MVRLLKFLQYQTIAYWRRAFAIRGRYDGGSMFLILLIAGFAYLYVSILNSTAKSLADGETKDLNLLFGLVFLAWILPVLEGQDISAQTKKFLYLPISKTHFALINLFIVFLLPTSLIAAAVSLAAIYPLAFSKNVFAAIAALLIFVLFSVFAISAFVNLLKMRFFRVAVFVFSIICFVSVYEAKAGFLVENAFSPSIIIARSIVSENQSVNILTLMIYVFAAFCLAFFSQRQAIFAQTNRRLHPQFLSRIKLPFKFGELIKKDFLHSWKTLDCWISLLITIFYALLLSIADFSFASFSVAISISVMMCGSLAFNIFGLENSSGIERLSLLPIKAEDLMAAKNKAFAAVVFSQTLFLFPLLFYKFGMVLTIISVLKIISIILLYTAWGNRLSIKYPFQMRFYQLSFGGSIPAMLYGVLAISLFIIVPEFATAGNTIIKLMVNVLLIGISFLIYKFALRRTSRKLPENWNDIALKLS